MNGTRFWSIIHSQPSYTFGTASTRVSVTRTAGMMAPVTFFADSDAPIQPYYIAPWADEAADTLPLLQALRGDFFCAPFGDNAEPFEGRTYPPHGEPSNEDWIPLELRETGQGAALSMAMDLGTGGRVTKHIAALEGESVVYSLHTLAGIEGPMCLGHHPCLVFPEGVEARLSFAPHIHAHTYTQPVERPENRGYSALRPDTAIEDLTRVPTIHGGTTDLTRYPARRGYEDIVMLCGDTNQPFGWTCASVPECGYAWFSLKPPKKLCSTLLWMSNGGRHWSPFNGRNLNCLGLEEITGYFHEGLASSARANFISKMGHPTFIPLSIKAETHIPFIQGVARVPSDFGAVARLQAADGHTLELVSETGRHVEVKLDLAFLETGRLHELV